MKITPWYTECRSECWKEIGKRMFSGMSRKEALEALSMEFERINMPFSVHEIETWLLLDSKEKS